MKKIILISIVSMLLVFTGIHLVAGPIQEVKEQAKSLQPVISIGNVTSSFGKLRVEIKNIGDDIATDFKWTIAINGGILNLIDQETTGTIEELDAGESIVVESDFVIGFGDITADITIGSIGKTVEGRIMIFFITINPEFTIGFDVIADGFNSPIYATHPGDESNRLFIVDQIGIIYVIEDGALLSTPFLDISDDIVDLDITYDERGLLGLAFHPEYETNGRLFVYYSQPKSGEGINHETVLVEYSISEDENIADPLSKQIIFRIDQPEANHNGGQVLFGPDGYLYLGLGDGGGAGDEHGTIGNGQDITTALGSIIRIDVDGQAPYEIPSDNPFVGSDGLDEIYAYGLRNPWRFSFDSVTDDLFVADVGQDEWEEINILEKGGNYGWRILEATYPYDPDLADELEIDLETLKSPIHEYSHSLGRSITGGYVYRGVENLDLIGKYIFGDWSSSFVLPRGKLFYLEEVSPGKWQRFDLITKDSFNRFVLSFGEDENGEIYVLSKTTLGPTGTTGDVRKIIIE